MSRRLVVKALRANGCRMVRDTGPHTAWLCLDGAHTTFVPRHTTIPAGVVRSIENQMICLPKGWLQ